jgi:hypothetical protein
VLNFAMSDSESDDPFDPVEVFAGQFEDVWVVVRLPIPAVAVDKLPGSDDGDSDEPGDINDMRVSVSIGNATPQ